MVCSVARYKRLLTAMSVSLLLGLVYLISELLLTATRRSRSRTGTKQDRSTLRVFWGPLGSLRSRQSGDCWIKR